jgi:hypothetical protein
MTTGSVALPAVARSPRATILNRHRRDTRVRLETGYGDLLDCLMQQALDVAQ